MREIAGEEENSLFQLMTNDEETKVTRESTARNDTVELQEDRGQDEAKHMKELLNNKEQKIRPTSLLSSV